MTKVYSFQLISWTALECFAQFNWITQTLNAFPARSENGDASAFKATFAQSIWDNGY